MSCLNFSISLSLSRLSQMENYTDEAFLLHRSLFISKKFFWFSDEPLEQKHLSTYLSSEKADIAHRNAAHAMQTGKGLLFFTKRAEDKDHPTGVLNLVCDPGFEAHYCC